MPAFYQQIIRNINKSKQSENDFLSVVQAANEIKEEISGFRIPPLNMIIKEEAQNWQNLLLIKEIKNFEEILVVGVGGSSLGAKVFCALKFQNKVRFLESIDPETVSNLISQINLEKCLFLIISKSGETIETICQTLIIIGKMQEINAEISAFNRQFVFITEAKESSLAKIAKKIGSEILDHPKDVGGRFSCFSIVGLLPAIVAGIDVKAILDAAKITIENFLKTDPKNCQIIESCYAQMHVRKQGYLYNVLMPYIDNFRNFVDWYRQLWAESLGKNGFNATPINSQGTVDQHSQLQLYLEGSRDKFFTFITRKNYGIDMSIVDFPECQTLFGGKKLSHILSIEERTTIESLSLKNLPIREFAMEVADESGIAALMTQMILETLIMAKLNKINPFDQPAVELRKEMAKAQLSIKN